MEINKNGSKQLKESNVLILNADAGSWKTTAVIRSAIEQASNRFYKGGGAFIR